METESYVEFQKRLRARLFCIGWHPVDSQKRTYYPVLYDSWHEAEQIAIGLRSDAINFVFFVEAVTNIKDCDGCTGTGKDEDKDHCGHCHGRGKIRA